MSEGNAKRKNVSAVVFAQAVRDAADSGEGILGIANRTGLKTGSVSTRLNAMRRRYGKDAIPSFRNGGTKRIDDKAVLAILNPQK